MDDINQPDVQSQEAESTGLSFKLDVQTIVGGCLVGLLILAGLMLPPVALGRRLLGFGFERITENNPVVSEDGLAVSLATPGGSLRVRLDAISSDSFYNRRAGSGWRDTLDALPAPLELVSPLYDIEGRGSSDSEILLEIARPEGLPPGAALDPYTWDPVLGEWVFVPYQIDPASGAFRIQMLELPGSIGIFRVQTGPPLLSLVQEPGQSLDSEMAAAVNILMPAGLQPAGDGSLTGDLATGAVGEFGVMPLIRDYSDLDSIDTASISAVLANTAVQEAHLTALTNLVVAGGNTGIALDYRGLAAEQRAAYSAFVAALAGALHEQDKQLAIIVPPPTPGADPSTWNTTGYDWRALGSVADMVIVQPAVSPGDYTTVGQGGQVLAWATGEVSRLKLHLSITSLSVDVASSVGVPVAYDEALDRLSPTVDPPLPGEGEAYDPGVALTFNLGGDGVSNVGMDPATGVYRYDYADDTAHQVWIVTADKLRQQLALTPAYNLAGVVVRDLLSDGNAGGIRRAVLDYKVNAPLVAQEGFRVEWAMKNASDEVVRFETLPFGDSFAWAADFEGELTAVAELLDPQERAAGSLSFIVGAIVEEETEEEEEPAPVVEAPTEPVEQTTVAAPPPAVSAAAGGFELGGQTHTLGDAGLMQQAGMTWVKFQQKWTPGLSGYDVGGVVELGHANGFKVLMSIPGPLEPASIDYAAYVQYLREVAETGADGIEIWNEMNLSREWPANDINGASYVNNMLAPAYNAIKAVNPGILVMSGALAPTGAFGGGCGDLGFVSGCDDWIYVQQMASAGAGNYMDCVGVHFNAGATSPTVSSGHPAGDAPSWYYWGTMGTYSPVGKPACITELGYLTDEGYPSVAGGNFGWAQNTTVAQQAQWLAEAVNQAKTHARLAIIWNVDIFTYDAANDPQAGYAIIRPGGSCPACDAIDAVMP